ncbi:MAG TPA: VCBS repeat-containing protein [Steroidobacteraceae bacterium]|nr:VCBS repeat-containing protein [Steroidobacteraceae bacterium]
MSQSLMGFRHLLGLSAAVALLSSCDDNGWCDGGSCNATPPGEISLALVAGNFNGNGHTSIVATSTVEYQASFNPGNLNTYLSTGAGSFATPTVTAAGDDPLYLASADLNGDHLPDVVSASYDDGTLSVFLNNTSTPGGFAAPVILSSPGASQVAIGDMNGDGLPDLVSADFGVSLFLQTSPGHFASPVSLYSGGANWVAVGDLNGDGQPDVALADAVGVKVLIHTGAASSVTYAAPVSVFTQSVNPGITGANIIAIADVNGDGLKDLVITDPGPFGSPPTVNVLLQVAAHPGTFASPVTYQLPGTSTPESLVVTDVNGDGHPDIVVGGSTAVSVLLQIATAPGTFAAASNYAVVNANEVAVADVNGDGLVDIIVPMGVSHPVVSGIVTNNPGVLLQVAGAPGTFANVQDLP